MGLKVEYRKFIRCDSEADLDSQYGEEALYYAVAENTYWQWSEAANDFLPIDPKELFVLASELISLLSPMISGTPDGSKFLRDDWTWDTPEGTGGTGTNYFLGVFASLSALTTAYPTANEGEYAYVDAGIGTDITTYIWDDTDATWVQGGSTPITPTLDQVLTAGKNAAQAINEAKGSDIASAATTDIGAATGNYVHVTGTTTITALGTVQAGTRRKVRFTGILTLTHNATSLILPTGANITTTADDVAEFISLGSGNWICTAYQRKDGSALAGGGAGDEAELAFLESNFNSY